MGTEIRYRCKDHEKRRDCKEWVVISKRVFELMQERGESLPERCDTCRSKHKVEVSEIKHPYFQVDSEDTFVSSFSFFQSAFTPHGERDRRREERKPDTTRWGRIGKEHVLELYQKLEQNQVVILASPTGTGKSTYIPYRLVEPLEDYQGDFTERLIRRGQLIQTQPLSSAVERIPETIGTRLIGESGAKPMLSFGLRHRGKEEYDRKNIGVIVTDGSLRNWIRDGHLAQYSLIMIDEAHKRTLNIDSLLSLLKKKLLENPHVRLIISSATINIDEFKKAFEEEGISVDIFDLSESLAEEINYHVHFWQEENKVTSCDCWLCRNSQERTNFWASMAEAPPSESQLPGVVTEFVMQILRKTGKGSILVFLPGEATIKGAEKQIIERKKEIDPKEEILVIPIYRRLGEGEVAKRFNQRAKRRVLLCTDIAETSHTLEDIVYVIDSGYIKQSQWDSETEVASLPTIRHSQAGCKQRWGRAGRTQKGYVFCLYTRDEFYNEFEKQTTPEILRSPLDDFVLTLKAAGIKKEIPLVTKPDKEGELNREIERTLNTIKRAQFIDDDGNVTDEGLEIFHTPVSSRDIALINPADEQNCLLEMMTMLSLMSTPEGEVRTGNGLYHPLNGLFMWDPYWDAKTKMMVFRVQKSFQACCKDDLDLVMKLAICFQKAREKQKERQWGLQNFINYKILEEVLAERDKIINDTYRVRVKEIREEADPREINVELLDKLRYVVASVLHNQIAEINTDGSPSTFKLDDKVGLVSRHCSGSWSSGETCVLATIGKDEAILDGYKKVLPVASFLLKIPRLDRNPDSGRLFLDQKFPVGSKVQVREINKKYFIFRPEPPSSIEVNYIKEKEITLEKLLEDYLRTPEYMMEKWFTFDKSLLGAYEGVPDQVEAVWLGEGKSSKAKIVEWSLVDGVPKAIITALNERTLLQRLRKEKKVGDTLRVKIAKVFRDPYGKRGWVLSKTEDGLEIPIEMADLSLSEFGYGLERIEGETLELKIAHFDPFDRPRLKNVDRVIEDLRQLGKEVEKNGKVVLPGYIEDIDTDRNRVIVTVVRRNGVVHFFEIAGPGLPTNDISSLKIGAKVIVTLFFRRGKGTSVIHELSPHEIRTLPGRLKYEPDKFKITIPYCLEKENLQGWSAEELVDLVIRESWRYFLMARFNLLQEGDIINGTVTELTRYKESGEISGVKVKVEIGGVQLSGFAHLRNLTKIPEIGKSLRLKVISAEGPDLILSECEE